MKMFKIIAFMLVAGGLLALAPVGCGSNTTENGPLGGAGGSGAGGTGGDVFGLIPGSYCYQVTTVANVTDGCDRGVADYVGVDVQGNYTQATATFILGKDGSLGKGQLAYNEGLLTREGDTSDPSDATCKWHQRDDTTMIMTATNTFTVTVVEVQSNIAAACGVTGTTCTSSWTWTMTADPNKSPTTNCQ